MVKHFFFVPCTYLDNHILRKANVSFVKELLHGLLTSSSLYVCMHNIILT